MSWPIKLHAERPEHPEVGDMFPAPWLLDEARRHRLSPPYIAERMAHRPPLVVRLPGPVDFCIDEREWSNGNACGTGWTVTGEMTALTLSPSINITGIYHGYIQNGFITPDCEGRTF